MLLLISQSIGLMKLYSTQERTRQTARMSTGGIQPKRWLQQHAEEEEQEQDSEEQDNEGDNEVDEEQDIDNHDMNKEEKDIESKVDDEEQKNQKNETKTERDLVFAKWLKHDVDHKLQDALRVFATACKLQDCWHDYADEVIIIQKQDLFMHEWIPVGDISIRSGDCSKVLMECGTLCVSAPSTPQQLRPHSMQTLLASGHCEEQEERLKRKEALRFTKAEMLTLISGFTKTDKAKYLIKMDEREVNKATLEAMKARDKAVAKKAKDEAINERIAKRAKTIRLTPEQGIEVDHADLVDTYVSYLACRELLAEAENKLDRVPKHCHYVDLPCLI